MVETITAVCCLYNHTRQQTPRRWGLSNPAEDTSCCRAEEEIIFAPFVPFFAAFAASWLPPMTRYCARVSRFAGTARSESDQAINEDFSCNTGGIQKE